MITKTGKVWLGGAGGITRPLTISQYDSGWTFALSVYDGSSLYDPAEAVAVTLEGDKPDGTAFAIPGTFSAGVATFAIPADVSAVSGAVACELRVSVGDETVGTANFEIYVEAAPLAQHVTSEDNFAAMQALLDEVSQDAASAAQSAATAESAAGTAAQTVLDQTPAMVDAWLEDNIDPASGYALDRSLQAQNAAAPADLVGELKSAFENSNIPLQRITGFYELNGIPAAQALAHSLILSAEIYGDRSTFSSLRINSVLNSVSYSKLIRVRLDNEQRYAVPFDSSTGFNTLTVNGSTLYLKIDWNRFTTAMSFNETEYADCYLQISPLLTVDEKNDALSILLQNREQMFNHVKLLSNAPQNFVKSSSLILKIDIFDPGSVMSEARFSLIQNTANYPKSIRLRLSDETVVYCNYNETTKFNEGYLPNSRISVLFDWDRFETDMTVNVAGYASSYLEIVRGYDVLLPGYARVSKCSDSGRYANTLINADLGIGTTSNTHYSVIKYAVQAGKTYVVAGNGVSLSYSTYPLAVFGTSDYTGGSTVTASKSIIPAGNTATATNYDVLFSPASNGFIYINKYDSKNELFVFDADYVSSSLYQLTNSNNATVKVQVFGDSITDDSWRTDHTTWATLFPSYFAQRQIDLVNSAVGGSHIGHGKVTPPGTKYPDLEYNYVYDLVTNPDIFEPDSDIFVIFSGANDFNSGDVGEWGDTTVSTFYGALRQIIEYITTNTDAALFVCTPLCRYSPTDQSRPVNADGEPINSRGQTLRDFTDAVIKTCEFYQIPVIDLFHNMGFNRNNIAHFTDEGLHPNLIGAHKLAQYISSQIRDHVENYTYLADFS